jgi:hypothetical protein
MLPDERLPPELLKLPDERPLRLPELLYVPEDLEEGL